MTTTIDILESLQKWLQDKVCSQFKFKKPDDENVSGAYNYTLVNPSVFLMFPPSKDVNNNNAVIPSVTIQFDNRTDTPTTNEGIMHVRLNFATWDPGMHTNDGFKRNVEGWRDVLNFVEATLQELKNTEFVDGIRVLKERGIESGPISEQGAIIDFYPYWFAYVSFYCGFKITSTKKKYSEFL